jgi:hypothetical protein
MDAQRYRTLKRMSKYIELIEGSECTEWSGAKNKGGYPNFLCGGRTQNAHRVLYRLIHGPFPEHLVVRHTCDNPSCLNTNHLALGRVVDNSADRWERTGWRKNTL